MLFVSCYIRPLFFSLWTETVRIRLWLSEEDSFAQSIGTVDELPTKKKKKEKRARIDPPVPCPPIVISCTFLSLAGDFCQLYQLREKLITGVVCNSCDTHTPTVEQLIDFLLFVYLTVINREYFFGEKKNSKRRICSERTAANFNWADPVVGFLRFMFPPQLVSDCQLLFLVLRGVRLNCCIGL